jgi:hypothetical protein
MVCTLLFHLREHRCALANFDFAVIFGAPKIVGYGTWGAWQVKGNATAHPKISSLKQTIWQMQPSNIERNCHARRLHLEKADAISGS